MRRKAIIKLAAAATAIAFMTFVRPSSVPGMGVVSAIAIIFFELNVIMLRELFPKKKYHTASRIGGIPDYDMRAWANTKVAS